MSKAKDLFLEELNKNLENCICGKHPKISHEYRLEMLPGYDIGDDPDYIMEKYVECSCGLRGMSFSYETTIDDIKDDSELDERVQHELEVKASEWWNKYMRNYRREKL